METNRVIGPSKPQLALAMAIVKQKPAEKAVKDYILQLRAFVNQRDGNETFLEEQFFDSISFWQDAYQKAQAEHAKLLDTIYELEQRNQTLLARTHNHPNVEVKGQSTKKRSILDCGPVESLKNSAETRKRPRGQSQNARVAAASKADQIGLDQDNAEVEPVSILRSSYSLQRALQSRRTSSVLAIHAVTLCKEAEQELLTAVLAKNIEGGDSSTEKPKKPRLTVLIKGMELAFHLMHRTLHKIANSKDGSQHKGQVTYYLVCLFESTLTALTEHFAGDAGVGASADSTIRAEPPQLTSQKVPRKGNIPLSGEKKEMAQRLTDLLCTMALSLNLSRPEDQEVLEGFLFVALNRVGKLLAFFTFAGWRSSSKACPRKPTEGLASITPENYTAENAQLEAKCLLTFLNNTLGRDSKISTLRFELIRPLKGRLQKSLLQAVFGDNDPFFKDGLARPATPPPQHCDWTKVDELGSSEWFVQGLWRLVGWDMLSCLVHES